MARRAWESGGEDWPNAHRCCPMDATEAMGCVVTLFHPQWKEAAFMQYTGLLFGLPLAVTRLIAIAGFSKRLAEDDFSITDRSCCRRSAQFAVGELNRPLQTPFSSEKQQKMAAQGTFLGLDHDFSRAHSHGQIHFWARERIQEKLSSLILSAREPGSFPPGIAAKVYGVANFLDGIVWASCWLWRTCHQGPPGAYLLFDPRTGTVLQSVSRSLPLSPSDVLR